MATLTKRLNQGVDLIHQGKAKQAAELLRQTIKRYPGDADALHLLSVALFQEGNPQAAVDYARRSINAAADRPDYHSNLGRYYLALGRLSDATDELHRALQLAPEHAMARYNLAAALSAQRDKPGALEAVRHYIQVAPEQAAGHHLAGTLLSEIGRPEESVPYFERALALLDSPETRNNFGNALQNLGRAADAILQYEQALRRHPEYPEAASNLGTALQALGHNDDARAWFEHALRVRPGFAQARINLANLDAESQAPEQAAAIYRELLAEMPTAETWNHLGNALQELGRLEESLDAYWKALELNPGYFLVHNNIGNLLRRQGRAADAIPAFERALEHNAQFAEAFNNLGVAYADLGRNSDAQTQYELAIAARADYPDPWINLGNLKRDAGQPRLAIECYRKAVELDLENGYAWNNLGCALGDQNDIAGAIQCFTRAVALKPGNHQAFSNILLNMHYLDIYRPEEIHGAHLEYGKRYDGIGAHLRKDHTNVPDPERRLRVGYVSADFRRHSVAFFLEPVLERHGEGSAVEVYCYADVARPDPTTARFQQLAGNNWRDVRGFSTERFAEQVRADRIDILVDLGGHTAHSRLADFTARPAPVQLTWLGYPDTTGLESIGYRITDAHADPPNLTEPWHSETLVRLDGNFLCYRPPADAPEPAASPSITGAPFTFGSFNNLSKISASTIRLWAKILDSVPGSRVALKNRSFNEFEARRLMVASFSQFGIGEKRLLLSGLIDSLPGHLDAYRAIDVALDTFPYHGTTTTCEALWMGVPVVTMAGQTHASRVGVSLLSSVGLAELIAVDEEAYVSAACGLANSPHLLKELRAGMRDRMRQSSLMDEAGFVQKLESAYRAIWRDWCAGKAQA